MDFGAEQWYRAGSSWLKVTPWGIREALKWATKTFTSEEKGQPTFYITENGFSDLQGNTDDLQRIYYYKHYINQVFGFENLIEKNFAKNIILIISQNNYK